MIITVDEISSASQKFMFFLNNIGNNIKRDNDGKTNQKIFEDNEAIFSVLFVSMYIQINERKDTNGIEARIPPINEDRFEISEIITIITAVMITLNV